MVSHLWLLQCLILSIPLVLGAPPRANPNQGNAVDPKSKLPAPLTEANFDETIAKNLHIIEFFSPYCHHCKQLAPIWEKTYNDFYDESLQLNISLHQVDCIESGDLCMKEGINAYPTIRLYGPEGFIKAFPRGLERTETTLLNFARKEALDADNLDITKLSSKSKLLNDGELLKILSEPQTEPYFVSFWPTSDFEDIESSYQFKNCEDCSLFQRIWKLVSNKADSIGINTVHFNCVNPTDSSKNEAICRELSFDALTQKRNSRLERFPEFALILPNRKSGSFIKFPFGPNRVDSESLIDFATRTLHNSNVPKIDQDEIEAFVKEPKRDILEANAEDDKILLVFNYNPETVVPEDMQFLEQLIDPLGYIPNIYLYKNTDDLKKLSHTLYQTLYKDYNTDQRIEFNEDHFITTSITQSPTFFIFKKSTFTPIIFPGYSTTETRNLDFILDWLTINSLPTVTEITSKNFEALKGFEQDFYDKLVIQLVNKKNNKFEEGSRKIVEGLRVAAHSYEILRNEAVYEGLKTAREEKKKLVQKLKNKNAPSVDIVTAMRKEIDYSYNHKVIFAYLDINESPSLLNNKGLNVYFRKFKTGDIIVVDKQKAIYYEKDASGQYITLETLPEVLSILNFPARHPGLRIERIFLRTPLSGLLRLIDCLREFSGINYLFVVVTFLALWKIPRAIHHYKLKRRYAAKRDTHGILGKEAKLMD
ncbi:Eps1 [Kluyveromyces lactis]|nr:Eps1 [Kluyveromyces lactis]